MTAKTFDRLVWHTPSLDTFLRDGVGRALVETHTFDSPLMVLLAARWFECFKHSDGLPVTAAENIGDVTNSVIVISDYAASSRDVWWVSVDELRAKGNLVLKFSCVGDTEEGFLRGALNAFDYARAKPVAADGFYELGSQRTHENPEIITVPMGCGSSWLPRVSGRRDKVVLLDEVHGSVIDAFDDEGKFDVLAYKHALKVCDHLWAKGFRVVTFCRSSQEFIRRIKERHPYLEIIDWSGWMPFSEVVKHYAAAPLFFSHFHEAHGYPIYENLQLGNGVIGYVENINQHVIRQFQNGVLLASTMPADLAADMVERYFQRYTNADLRPVIASDAHERFSCETFVKRLIRSLAAKGIEFSA